MYSLSNTCLCHKVWNDSSNIDSIVSTNDGAKEDVSVAWDICY